MKDIDKNITKYLLITLTTLIIAMIMYPVYKITKKEKDKISFEDTINNIIATAKDYYSKNSIFEDDYVVFTIKDGKIIEDGLNYYGQLPNSGSILINSSGDIQIIANDENWCATKRYTDNSLNIEEYSNNCGVIKSTKLGNINVALSNTEDGLYQEGQTFYYRGSNPNNFIELNGILFRILSIDENKNLKLISNDILVNRAWNLKSITNNSYNILDEDNIAYYINYLDSSNESFNKLRQNNDVLEYSWTYLQFDYTHDMKYNDLNNEKNKKNIMAVVGLISVPEYIRASLNAECTINSLRNEKCGTSNFLSKGEKFFTMSTSNDSVWAVSNDGKVYETSLNISLGIRPVIVLSGTIQLKGKGTLDNPYIIIK